MEQIPMTGAIATPEKTTTEASLKRKADTENAGKTSEKKKRAKKKILHFVSGNKKKFEEIFTILQQELPDIEVKQIEVDLPELQGDPMDIVKNKLMLALDTKAKGHPLIVEDTSLCFNSWGGLPGPYIKSFLTKLGLAGLHKMSKTFDDTSAYAQCIFGLTKSKKDGPHLFIGKTEGEIVEKRGPENFGWDPIFQPKGREQTYAEMGPAEKNTLSHRSKALREMIDFFKNNPDYF